MNKKNVKYVLVVLISIILTFINVKAESENLVMEYINNPYYLRYFEDGSWDSGRLTYYYLNGNVAYCVEPGVHITTNIYEDSVISNLSLSDDVLEKIKLIGYYGYEYPNHNTEKYHMATQALIWEVSRNIRVEYYSEKNGMGDYIDISLEKQEIMNLVNNHYVLPNFETLTLSINQEEMFVDNNHVLEQFTIINNNSNLDIYKDKNNLYVKSNIVGDYEITLKKEKYDNQKTILYIGNDGISQKLMKLRIDNEFEYKINIHIDGGKLFLHKLNDDTKSYNNFGLTKLENAIYGIYDSADNLVETITTNELGEAVSNYLSFKTYYLKEIKPSYGYELDNLVYEFTIDINNLEVNLEVYEKMLKKDLTVIKCLEGDGSILKGESDVTFEIYLNDSLYETITTNEEGIAKISLPYGKYLFHQVNTKPGYLKSDDFTVLIDETESELTKIIYDKKIDSHLEIIKVDSKTGTSLSDALFLIYDSNDSVIFEKYTDEFGKIVIENLDYDKYKIQEQQAPDGYILNNEEYYVDITSDNNYVTLTIPNNMIEIEVPNTSLDDNNLKKYLGIIMFIIGFLFIFSKKLKIRKII